MVVQSMDDVTPCLPAGCLACLASPFGRRVSWYGGRKDISHLGSAGLCPAAPLPRCEIAPYVRNVLAGG